MKEVLLCMLGIFLFLLLLFAILVALLMVLAVIDTTIEKRKGK